MRMMKSNRPITDEDRQIARLALANMLAGSVCVFCQRPFEPKDMEAVVYAGDREHASYAHATCWNTREANHDA